MAIQGRRRGAGSEASPETPREPTVAPEIGRDYVMLVSRQTGRQELCLLSEWERMKAADGSKSFGVKRCSTCGSEVVQTCVAITQKGRAVWRETCDHLRPGGAAAPQGG